MKEECFRKLLEKHVETYLNNIAVELESSHDQWFENFGFPIFGETSKEYHEQVYFQSYLESYTRKMINGILQEVCYEDAADKISWPELEFFGVYNGYTNIESEQEFGFEFINHGQKIGYRYTKIEPDKIDQLLERGSVNSIVLVIWQNEDDPACFCYADDRVRVILLWELFQELFCEDEEEEIRTMYDLFTDYISKAVEQANSMISLTTLPGFTSSYLYKTREKTVGFLKNEVMALSSFNVKNQNYRETELNSKQLIENYHLPQYFLKMQMEQAFVGLSTFAKSYLTSEYLYQYFKGNSLFDFTPIVSGYIKSIEQLLHVLCSRYRNSQHEYINMGSYTLGDYIEYLKTHTGIFRNELLPAKDIVINCLDSYRIESRNHLFHKDYLNTWERVEQIRKNTVFLYVALLGSADTTLITDNNAIMGSLNIEYDRMFHILDSQDEDRFLVVLNGKEYSGMEKETRHHGLRFNKNGLIANTIKMCKYVYDHYECIEISRTNMPSQIWIMDSHSNKKDLIWPIS